MYNSLGLACSLSFVDIERRSDFMDANYWSRLKQVLLHQQLSADIVRPGFTSLLMLVKQRDILMDLAWSGLAAKLHQVCLFLF